MEGVTVGVVLDEWKVQGSTRFRLKVNKPTANRAGARKKRGGAAGTSNSEFLQLQASASFMFAYPMLDYERSFCFRACSFLLSLASLVQKFMMESFPK